MNDESTVGDSVCALIAKAREGCGRSREDLFQQLESYMSIIAARQLDPSLRPKVGASDLVQESFAIALEQFDQFRGESEGELYAWVSTIIQNKHRQQRRAYFTDKRKVSRERSVEMDSRWHQRGADLADPLPTPAGLAVAEEEKLALIRAMSRLPHDMERVIRLRNWERLPFKEIAELMDRSVNAVTKLWYRALAQLQDELDQNDG